MFSKLPNKNIKRTKKEDIDFLFEEIGESVKWNDNPLYFLEENRDYLNEEEGGRSRGEVMETAIVDAWNNKGKLSPKIKKLLASQKPEPIPEDAPIKIFKIIKKNLKGSGSASVLGASQIDVSKEWKKFWPGGRVPSATKTPKTDIKIGKARISLKSGDSAQLMSGGKNESRATFYTALEKAKGLKKSTLDKAKKSIENLSESNVTEGTLAQAIKEGKDELVNIANKAHKDLKKDMESLFNQSPEFKREFAFEAMTGSVKFNDNDGTCDYFLCVDWEGEKVKLKICTDREYVDHIADQMNISVRFKTTSEKKKIEGKTQKTGNYRYWSVIGLIVNKLNEEVDNAPSEIKGLMNEEISSLDESTFGKVKDFLKDLWNKTIKILKDYISKAWNWIADNARRLMIFLGFIPEIEGWSDESTADEMNKSIDYFDDGGEDTSSDSNI